MSDFETTFNRATEAVRRQMRALSLDDPTATYARSLAWAALNEADLAAIWAQGYVAGDNDALDEALTLNPYKQEAEAKA